MITRREFLTLPLAGWFGNDDYELQRLRHDFEEYCRADRQDMDAVKRVIGETIGAMIELARIIDQNTAYLEARIEALEQGRYQQREREQI